MDGMMLRAWEASTLFFITTIEWAIVQKLFVPISLSDVVHTQSSWMCASLLSTWGYCGVEQFISNGTKYACDVKLIARGILASSLLRLRLSTSGSTSSHGFHQLELPRHCCIEGLLKLLVKHWLHLRVASTKGKTRCFFYLSMGATFSNRQAPHATHD